uniref:Uncharacterized protein n=1 Tax=Panagrolaimus davidi TaxID=227884 RepID=A0A914P5W8_9BILA
MLPSESNSTVEDNIATAKALTGELNNLATLMTKKGYISQNISRNFPFSFSDVIDTTSNIVNLLDRFLPELLPAKESESFKKAVSDVFKTIDSVAKPTLQMQPINITLSANLIKGSVKAYITYKSENTFNHMKKSCHENNTYDILTLLNSNLYTFSKLKNSLYTDESIDNLYQMAYKIALEIATFAPFCYKAETNKTFDQSKTLMFHLQNIQRTFTSLQSYCYEHSWDDDVAYKIMTNFK